MPNILPALRNTSQQVLYPFTRTVSCMTAVKTFVNGSEQRWSQRPPLMTLALPMTSLQAADKASWLTFFSTIKGKFEQNLQVTFGGVTYSDFTCMEDELSVVNAKPLQYNQQVSMRQVLRYPYTPPTAPTAYPTLSFGKVAEMPFSQIARFQTANNDSKFGPQYSWEWYGAGLTGFPTTFLKAWKLEYPLINDADLATLETTFLGTQGRLKSFSFVDPLNGTNYTHVRFASDELAITYHTVNQNSTSITLVQTFGS